MDDSFHPVSSASGIGGVLKDHSSSFLLHFTKHVEANSTIHVEVLAIREGILVAATSRWSGVSTFIIESDSSNVVSWFSDPARLHWRFQSIIRETLFSFTRHISWSIIHTCRSGNEAANILALVDALG